MVTLTTKTRTRLRLIAFILLVCAVVLLMFIFGLLPRPLGIQGTYVNIVLLLLIPSTAATASVVYPRRRTFGEDLTRFVLFIGVACVAFYGLLVLLQYFNNYRAS